ncbi:MAG: energy-coupling factor transporter transmembrane protein EcfT [Oscillospiraceae bacterium]|nr:energy-coupling factor transporter transmembrane protein EcfT [Oscillospiraceae bacterium]
MLRDITIGQYFPGGSVIHRMDPRMKLVLTFAFIVTLFLPKTWLGLAAAAVFLMVIILLTRLPFRLILRSVKPIIPIIIFTSVINIFYISEKVNWEWDWWIFHITDKGLSTAAFIVIRIVCLIIGSSLLTYTTSPTALTDGLERILRPLKVVRLNVHELAMMMTIALRFIPTLIEETDKIMMAQKARGADLDSGGLFKRIRAMIPILIPLFVSAFRRAYELAMAMECRCYKGGKGRTRMKILRLAGADWLALLVVMLLIGGLVGLNYVLPRAI